MPCRTERATLPLVQRQSGVIEEVERVEMATRRKEG